ncbi:RNA polymerase II-associated protein 3 [Linnemannia elongata]|nr:RNA polymerase II-associated protein 3 [Linnemannia elongata]
MDALTLQKLAQWEQAHASGNKKPLTAKEYPPMRSCQDITLKDIQPIQMTQKKARIEAVSAQEKKSSEQTTSPVTSTSPSTTSEAIKSSGLSRKAYYESWDKFDVDKALEDFERDDKRSSAKPSSISTNSTKTAPKPLLSKPSGATAANQVEPATMPSDSVAAANAEKEKGNELFKKGLYVKAIEHYSASIALDPSNSVLPINRAMALLKLERFAEAERDCTLGLKLDSKNVKALWRRGIARRSLGRVDEAKKDFETALTIDPINKAVKEELAKLKQGSTTTTPSSTTKPSATKASATATTPSKPVAKSTTAKKQESPASESSKPPVISSKRVLIKEVENDEDSELFSLGSTKRIAAEPKSTTPTASKVTPVEAAPKPVAVEVVKPTPSPTPAPTSAPVTPLTKPTTPPTTTSTSNPRTNMVAPSTTLDFQRDWKSYSKNNELLYQYIKLIQPEALPGIFKSSFESDYLSSMLTVFRTFYIPSEDPQLLYRSLVNLGKVQRFDMTLMFMTGTDKKDLVSILQHLASHVNDSTTTYSQQDLAALASKFKTTNY